MSDSDKPRGMRTHVFISYAREDQEIAVEVARVLREAGIRPWIDLELRPGTSNWDRAIRKAIEASLAVVFIASPATASSDYVGTELLYGKENMLDVIPFWIEGEGWGNCVPGLQWLQTQYIDARGARREPGARQLAERLGQLIRESTPGHFGVERFLVRSKGGHGTTRWKSERKKPIPPGCCSIELDDPENDSRDACDAIIVNCFAWQSFGKLGDELYSEYLRHRYSPYTYGSEWIIARIFKRGRRLALPWSWLLNSDGERLGTIWGEGDDCALKDVGMVPGSRWVVTVPTRERVAGFLLQDGRILDALLENPKVALYGCGISKCLEAVSADEVTRERFRVAAIASSVWDFESIPMSGGAAKSRRRPWVIAQTAVPSDPESVALLGRICDH